MSRPAPVSRRSTKSEYIETVGVLTLLLRHYVLGLLYTRNKSHHSR